MITLQEAVSAVREYVGQFAELMPTEDMRLEEFDFDDNHNAWHVTLSFFDSSLFAVGRSYREFVVDANDGSVRSMRVRNPFEKSRERA